jgi:hypothetical protein
VNRGRPVSGGRRTARIALAGAFAAGVLALGASAQPLAAPATRFQPEIRLLEPGRDDMAIQRIECKRLELPGKYARRRNFAWAVAKIDGLDKTEYIAHSKVRRKGDLKEAAPADAAGVSLQRRPGRFEVLCVNREDVVEGNGCFPRYADTEYKIIEDLAARLPDPSVTGRVRIYTDLYPCASCRHVMEQFLSVYTNVRMQVLYRER